MCNSIKKRSDPGVKGVKPIPKRGYGVKLMLQNGRSYFKKVILVPDANGWIQWDENHLGKGGFTFFLSVEEAFRYLQSSFDDKVVIRIIEYRGGIQERKTADFDGGYRSYAIATKIRFAGR